MWILLCVGAAVYILIGIGFFLHYLAEVVREQKGVGFEGVVFIFLVSTLFWPSCLLADWLDKGTAHRESKRPETEKDQKS